MRRGPWAFPLVLVLVLGCVIGAVGLLPGARAASSTGPPLSASVTGPNVMATSSTVHLTINASGGPAFTSNGTKIGNLTYYASVSASNLSGVAITPSTGAFTAGTNETPMLQAGASAEVVTVAVEVSSVYQKENVSKNLTFTITVVQPYVVSATLVNTGSTTVLPFVVNVTLDGTRVGNVSIPSIAPNGRYNLSFQYATLGLASGDHTFVLSLPNAHGLVSFANGQSSYTATFYVSSGASDNTLWYVLGGVAFVGVLFIFMTRVAARRRGAVRK